MRRGDLEGNEILPWDVFVELTRKNTEKSQQEAQQSAAHQ
ncbi:hypothetical protein TIFTF001_021895 [Ficus carica]|uniref:Uncharacterized protein n=1 Tax=Ficus carica TaxID=3494 RepID=A0AA88AHL5_FICCA|nr:hypothetical protein TIFTF001_021895 [Ficus carica]